MFSADLQFYLEAGECKYGESCRYIHSEGESKLQFNFLGLPIRLVMLFLCLGLNVCTKLSGIVLLLQLLFNCYWLVAISLYLHF